MKTYYFKHHKTNEYIKFDKYQPFLLDAIDHVLLNSTMWIEDDDGNVSIVGCDTPVDMEEFLFIKLAAIDAVQTS